MKLHPARFNTYFCVVASLLLLTACATTENPKDMGNKKKGKEQALIRLHLETNPDGTAYTTTIKVPRGESRGINVEVNAFLDSGSLLEAALIETDQFGGYAIRLQFNQHGIFALDTVSSSNRGRRVAILGVFGDTRWLAAPVMNRRISNGLLQFTPDVTREEAQYIVLGLNNVAAKLKKKGAL